MEWSHCQIIDKQTGYPITTYTYAKRNVARNRIDRLDNAHGGYRYFLKLITTEQAAAMGLK